jgi:hypothetical protein
MRNRQFSCRRRFPLLCGAANADLFHSPSCTPVGWLEINKLRAHPGTPTIGLYTWGSYRGRACSDEGNSSIARQLVFADADGAAGCIAFDFHSELHGDRVTSRARKGVARLIQPAWKGWASKRRLRMMARSSCGREAAGPCHPRSRRRPRQPARRTSWSADRRPRLVTA